jgi:aminoglycoside phosphotransferase (APT) family kinase protein
MERAVRHHFNKDIKKRIKLTGGWREDTWLLVLSDNQKIVFRGGYDFTTSGGRKISMADTFEREKFFYDGVNKKLGRVCPEVYIVDGTGEYYHNAFQISEYIEGEKMSRCFREVFDDKKKKDISYKIGELTARINSVEIDGGHPYVASRNSWEDYLAGRLHERLIGYAESGVMALEEINRITENMRNKKADKTLSFLHLDMRHSNMIYHNGEIFVVDAENCEFGDPLHELAVIDVAQERSPELIEGYKSVCKDINLDSELYYYYKLERLGLVLSLYMFGFLQNDTEGKNII